MRGTRFRWWGVAFVGFGLGLAWGSSSPAAPDDEDPDAEVPGLVVSYVHSPDASATARRIVPDLGGDWGTASPDVRVPAAGFVARWDGLLLIQSPGSHRFFARTSGTAVLRVADRAVVEGVGGSSRPVPIELPAGFVPIALEYQHRGGEARVAIDWEGPGFGREPLPARLFYHERAKAPPPDRFEEGRALADQFGCANCHALLDLPRHPDLGPTLADAGHAIDPHWLDAWLRDPGSVRPQTRMPAFGHGFSAAESADLAAFLSRLAPKSAPASNEIRMALNVADPARGRLQFASMGCLGCHPKGDASPRDRAAPDLSGLGRKRSMTWLAGFLEHPRSGKGVSRHRPDLRVRADDAAHLAAYLVADPPPAPSGPPPVPGDAARGKALADRARCASCHAIPGLSPHPADLRLAPGSSPAAGCLAADAPGPLVPRFSLTADQREALRAFVAGLPKSPAPSSAGARAEDSIRRLNCLGCHTRDGRGGRDLGDRIAARLATDPALGGLKGTLTPPNLTAVGDKLRPEYLALSVRGAAPTARPWLSVRMPAFSFEPGEADAIVAAFQVHDRMGPVSDPATGPTHPGAATIEASAQLIGQRGFGCISCHVVAGRVPPGGEPETLGPDLALAHMRMSERYFHRWIANPQRIIAGTPMPQFVKPVATAPGTLEAQLETIWQLLGSPRVGEAAASSTREVVKRQGDRALVVRDMILLPDAPGTPYTPRGLAIGLKNDHTLLFDTDRLTWLSWWHQGFLSRTKSGRLWEWHPEGERLWLAPNRRPPIVFLDRESAIVPPAEVRERFGDFSALDFQGPDVALTYRLNGPGGAEVEVHERLHPTADGWERRVDVAHVPDGYRPALAERPPSNSWSWASGKAHVSLHPSDTTPGPETVPGDPSARLLLMKPAGPGSFTATLRLAIEPTPSKNEE